MICHYMYYIVAVKIIIVILGDNAGPCSIVTTDNPKRTDKMHATEYTACSMSLSNQEMIVLHDM